MSEAAGNPRVCRQQAIPISGDTGIQDIERIFAAEAFDPPGKKGAITIAVIRGIKA